MYPQPALMLIVPCSGLTAYNHNLDTSREFYPSVGKRFPHVAHRV